MKMNTLLSRLIRPIWFVTLFLAFGLPSSSAASAFSSGPMLFAYDEQTQASIAYDGDSLSAFDYDSASMLSANESENPTVKAGDAFAQIAGFLAAETTVAEQERNALGQFTSKGGGQAAPGSTAVSDFVQNATQNGWSLVDREVSFRTPFGMRRYEAVLTDIGGINWGGEIKSSESAFSRWEGQQFSADRWINMNGGATAIGKQSGLQINGSAKILWQTP